jgi:hypothetical protein
MNIIQNFVAQRKSVGCFPEIIAYYCLFLDAILYAIYFTFLNLKGYTYFLCIYNISFSFMH